MRLTYNTSNEWFHIPESKQENILLVRLIPIHQDCYSNVMQE